MANENIKVKDLAKLVSKKTGYAYNACYEVLRETFDTIGDLLVAGEKITIQRIFTLYLETGLMHCNLNDAEVTYVRPRISLSNKLRERCKEDK